MPSASWLIGSQPNVPATSITVLCNAVSAALPIAAGNYYLYDEGSARDLLAKVAAALELHTQVTGATAFLRRNRYVGLTADQAFQITNWGSDTTIRDMLGFASTTGSTSDHTATLISRWLWSPGKTETPEARLGTDGIPYADTAVGQSGESTVFARTNNTGAANRFTWPFVDNDRVWTTSEAGGEYHEFWDTVLRHFYRFKLYRNVNEDTSLSSEASISVNLPSTGAYKMRSPRGVVRFPYEREFQNVEYLHRVELEVVRTTEYS